MYLFYFVKDNIYKLRKNDLVELQKKSIYRFIKFFYMFFTQMKMSPLEKIQSTPILKNQIIFILNLRSYKEKEILTGTVINEKRKKKT